MAKGGGGKGNKVHPGEWAGEGEGKGGGHGGNRHGPPGVPMQVCVKVGNPDKKKRGGGGDTDIRFSSNKLSIAEYGDYELDYVYGPEANYTDIMDRSIVPLVKAFSEGVSISIMVLGSHTSEKPICVEKLLPMTIQCLFGIIGKSKQGGKRAQNQQTPFNLKVQAFEIFDEVIQDLLNAENRDLQIIYDSLYGNIVSQCSVRGPYTSVDDVLDALIDSFNSRTSAMSDFGPASKHTNTVWEIDLHQVRGGLKSKLIFVETAGTEKLAEDRAAVRAREGPSLSKSVLALQSVAEAFSRREHDFAPVTESKLTQLLHDPLLGNSITLCIASVRQGEAESSAATVQLAHKLRSGSTFPTVNDDRVQGLIRHYRIQINRLRDELQVANSNSRGSYDASHSAAAEDVQEMTLKVNELEGKIIKDNLEKLRMKEEKEKIYAKLVEFREKYNQLVEQKSHIQSATIKGEEEKLKISKALLDLRIENNKLVERCEAEKYELVTKLLNAENEILQYEMKEETREKNTTVLKKELDDAKQIAEEHKMDLIQLKENFQKIETQFKQELMKNEELGVELLTLVNQKNALANEAEELRKERVKLLDDSKLLDTKQVGLISEKAGLEDALNGERKLTEQLKAEKMKLQLELQRKQVEFETGKLDFEKNASDVNRERETEIAQLKNKLEVETKRHEAQQEVIELELKDVKVSLKLSTRKIKELEQELGDKTTQLAELKDENLALNEKLTSLTEGYRTKLIELLSPPKDDNDDDSDDGKPKKRLSPQEKAEAERRALQAELVETFRSKETEIEKKLKVLQQTNYKIVEKNRTLVQKYTICRNKLEDMQVDVDKAETLADPKEFAVGTSQLEDQLRQELATQKEQLERTSSALEQAQEKNIKIAGSIKRITRENEMRLADLHAEVKMLERQKQNLEEENHSLTQRGSMIGANDPESTKQMQIVQNTLLKKMEEMQLRQSSQPQNSMPSFGGGDSSEIQRQNQQLQEELRSCKKQLEQARLASPFSGTPRKDNEEVEKLRQENKKLRELYSRKASLTEPQESGKSYADLLTRCTVAEQELSQYKMYLKQSLAKSQQEIRRLKQELAKYKS